MRKKYLLKDCSSEEKFWNNLWSKADIEEAIRFCEISPLRHVFETYFPKDGKILEGGCGPGYFVIYYKRKNYDIEGVDFAGETISTTLKMYNDIPIKEGNVMHLDYPDNYFKAYYSGGVVEHFEEGPYQVLNEARRVLCDKGALIISVPYLNISRVIKSYVTFVLGKQVCVDLDGLECICRMTDVHRKEVSPLNGFNFHQYEYTKKEFSDILKDSGFKIILAKPLNIIWGMKEFSYLRKLYHKMLTNKIHIHIDSDKIMSEIDNTHSVSRKIETFIKKVAISEDCTLWPMLPLLRLLGYGFANLMLFVCTVEKS